MKAKVVGVESADGWKDGQRRYKLKLEGNSQFDPILPEKAIGIVGLALDDELVVSFHLATKPLPKDWPELRPAPQPNTDDIPF